MRELEDIMRKLWESMKLRELEVNMRELGKI